MGRTPPPAPMPHLDANQLQDAAGIESADHWFDIALDLEDTDPQKAYEMYLRALASDPEHVEATINVGRLCSANGELQRAAAYFRQAIRVDAAHPVAHFNLAVTLHDLGELDGAVDAYRAALSQDPQFADAHYNLATLLEQQGQREAAMRHFAAYRNVIREIDNKPPA
jgi:tetratricopeptide (TPR) repeat protein